MPARAHVTLEAVVWDGPDPLLQFPPTRAYFVPGTGYKRELVSLTGSAFTALSPPSGAKAVLVLPGAATLLVLKGLTGDTGVSIVGANSTALPVLLPLSSPSIGVLNSGATATVVVVWL